MPTVTLEEAQARLAELIESLNPGEELRITKADRIIASLMRTAPRLQQSHEPRPPIEGIWMADDFDAPLEDFKEYME